MSDKFVILKHITAGDEEFFEVGTNKPDGWHKLSGRNDYDTLAEARERVLAAERGDVVSTEVIK